MSSRCFSLESHGSCEKYGNYDAPDSYADLTMRYAPNHIYCNYKDGHNEEDEMVYEESDVDAYNKNMDSVRTPVENVTQWRKTVKASKHMDCVRTPVENLTQWRKAIKASKNIDMHSVRCPVENLTQWKAIKAKDTSSKQKTRNPFVSETSFNF